MPPQGKPPLIAGYEIATLVISVALELAIPPAVGTWIDSQYGTGPWGVVIGSLLGAIAFATGLRHLLRRLEKRREGDGEGKRSKDS